MTAVTNANVLRCGASGSAGLQASPSRPNTTVPALAPMTAPYGRESMLELTSARPATATASEPSKADPAVALVGGPRREEQRVRRSRNASGPELERPEPVDRDGHAARAAKDAGVLEAAVRSRCVRVDPAVAEVADEQIAAEAAEIGGS